MEHILAIISILLIVSIIASKASVRLGVPSLLLFLFIGMLAGSQGLVGMSLHNPKIAQYVGIVALVFILFSGGIETRWESVRPVLGEGIALATLGVLITAALVGLFGVWVFGFSIYEGLLLGSIVSSTDAAAVFSVLRSKHLSLKENITPLLELESGSNDPMAVFLTLSLIAIIQHTTKTAAILPLFFLQMGIGALAGYLIGRGAVVFINRIKLEYDGLYPVLTVSIVLFTYAVASVLQGSGFLAVYVAGLMLGNNNFINRKNIVHFHGGIAWLMQISMFLVLGFLVFPSSLVDVAVPGLIVSVFLVFVARTVSVFITLMPTKFRFNEKAFISWVGLRGSVPIILATFPLLAGVHNAGLIFNIVFFTVITSTLLQGTTISFFAKLFKVDTPLVPKKRYPLEFEQNESISARLIDFMVPYGAWIINRPISDLELPPDSLISLVARGDDFIIPSGKTTIEEDDVLLILVNNDNMQFVQAHLSQPEEPPKTR